MAPDHCRHGVAAQARHEDDVLVAIVGALLGLGWWLLAGLVGFAVRHPLLALLAAGLALVVRFGYADLLPPAATTLAVLLTGWRVGHPGSFRRFVSGPCRSRWRRWWVYRRRWEPVLHAHGLVVTRGQHQARVPRLGRLRAGRWSDVLEVRLVIGQAPEDWEAAALRLAHAFGARGCRVEAVRAGAIRLHLTKGDALAAPVPAPRIPAGPGLVDLAAVPVGRREDGAPWALPVLGAHVLVAGATGAGKGSVFWSLLAGLAPAIGTGQVAVWALDPKGGMELAIGRPLFARFCAGTGEDMAALLEDAVTVMDARAARLAGHVRTHQPTTDDPLLVVLVDELASLTAYVEDRDTKRRIASALSLLLSKGRAAGVVVVAALQDPRKEVLPFRDLFPVRVALRLPEREQADMVLGPHAAERGARADLIPRTTPGVGYVLVDGQREPVRVRAGHVTDDDLRRLAADHPAPPSALVVPLRAVANEPEAREPRPRRTPRLKAVAAAEPVDGAA